jgi:hypothetical protein
LSADYLHQKKIRKLKFTTKLALARLRNQNLKSPPQRISYITDPKGNLSIKVPTPNLTQPLQASPLPSNDFYK